MQLKSFAISTFAATALAQASVNSDDISILQVLQTALPSSLVQEFITNGDAASASVASQFSAGATPTWFSGLPSDVQTYLVPQATGAVGGLNGTSGGNGTVGGNSTSSGNSTASTTSTRTRATITSTDDSSSETGSSDSQTSGAGFEGSSSESGNAAAPTAYFGAGLAGAVGIVGLLAL